MKRLVAFIVRFQHRFATAALVVGFVVDVITFRTLDLTFAIIILTAHLTVVAGSLLVIYGAHFPRVEAFLRIANQYSTGALLSAFLVLYASSGSLTASLPFLLLVVIAAVGNEVLSKERHQLPFQTSLFFLNLMLFMALMTPLIMRSLGPVEFLLSAWAALAVFVTFVWVGRVLAGGAFVSERARIRAGWIGVFVVMLVLYFGHLIPPIPLAAKSVGAYHQVTQVAGVFIARDEARGPIERFFDLGGVTLRLAPGEPAYFFSAIFAPARLDVTVRHRWEVLNPETRAWELTNLVSFSVTGGRPEGYRLYSLLGNPAPGRYRVSVETARGEVIARTHLTVVRTPVPLPLTAVELE